MSRIDRFNSVIGDVITDYKARDWVVVGIDYRKAGSTGKVHSLVRAGARRAPLTRVLLLADEAFEEFQLDA